MRRVTALCAAAAMLASTAAIARPMLHHQQQQQSGYYVIRWDDTGVCQIWNTDLTQKPWQVFSQYKIVSKTVPTFAAAATIQEDMRMTRHCTL